MGQKARAKNININRGNIVVLLLMIMIGISMAVSSTLTAFTGKTNPFNITFTGNQNQSFILTFPQYAYILNI